MLLKQSSCLNGWTTISLFLLRALRRAFLNDIGARPIFRPPEAFTRNLKLGEELHLTIKGDCLIIRKIPSLKDLLATVPDNFKGNEWDTGKSVGKEVIDDE